MIDLLYSISYFQNRNIYILLYIYSCVYMIRYTHTRLSSVDKYKHLSRTVFFGTQFHVRENNIDNKMTNDIFDNTIICKNCDREMKRVQFLKNGFTFRAVQCIKCGQRIIHPEDKVEYEHYMQLRGKRYSVKLRMVGNSYTVSIPREIVNFINEQDRIMDELVSLSFERMGKISLVFDKMLEEENKKNDNLDNDKEKVKLKKINHEEDDE